MWGKIKSCVGKAISFLWTYAKAKYAFCLLGISFISLTSWHLYIYYDKISLSMIKKLLPHLTILIGIFFLSMLTTRIPTFPVSSTGILTMLILALVALTMSLIIVMFDMALNEEICMLLGTSNKNETIKFIALGMGGVIAAIVAAVLNRRANALKRANELVEKGHINDRFMVAMKDLKSHDIQTRRSSFYQFYYLAKEDQEEVFKWDIFDILCARLCEVSHLLSKHKMKTSTNNRCLTDGTSIYTAARDNTTNSREPANDQEIYDLLKERHTLLSILFKKYFKIYVFNETGAELWDSYLAGANLEEANFKKAELQCACISGANLSKANLSKANLSCVDFSGTKHWDEEHWHRQAWDLTNKKLDDVKEMGACLSGADLSGADLSGADLSYADLSGANLSGAYLSGTNLSCANLSGANLSGADLSGMERWTEKHWCKRIPNFTNEALKDIKKMATNLSEADISNANFQKTQLEHVNLKNVYSIEGADFHGAKMGTVPIAENHFSRNKGEYRINLIDFPWMKKKIVSFFCRKYRELMEY